MSGGDRIGWVVLIPRLPSEPSRHRVAVWRELRRTGAIQLGQGTWAVPKAASFSEAVDTLVHVVARNEGDMLVLHAAPADQVTTDRLRGLYDDARRDEWDEFASECDKCVAELQREIAKSKFTLAELDEEEQNVDRLRRWHRELRLRDLFEAVPPDRTTAQLDECNAELERFTALVYRAVGMQ